MVKGVNLAALEAEYANAQPRPATSARQSDMGEAVAEPSSAGSAARPRRGRASEARKSEARKPAATDAAAHGLPQLPPPSPVQALRALGKKALGAVKSKVTGNTSKPRRKS
jgi:ribonuclease R